MLVCVSSMDAVVADDVAGMSVGVVRAARNKLIAGVMLPSAASCKTRGWRVLARERCLRRSAVFLVRGGLGGVLDGASSSENVGVGFLDSGTPSSPELASAKAPAKEVRASEVSGWVAGFAFES